MKRKNKMMIALIGTALFLFCGICFFVIPEMERAQARYERNQQDALTHDITAVENCKIPYLGDAVNVSRLFEQLPLNHVERKYKIDSENCALTVVYLDTVWDIGEQKVRQDLVYNAAAAMACIDNLSTITFAFPEYSYSFTRVKIEEVFGDTLCSLLDQKIWKERVQDKIASLPPEVEGCYSLHTSVTEYVPESIR